MFQEILLKSNLFMETREHEDSNDQAKDVVAGRLLGWTDVEKGVEPEREVHNRHLHVAASRIEEGGG